MRHDINNSEDILAVSKIIIEDNIKSCIDTKTIKMTCIICLAPELHVEHSKISIRYLRDIGR